MQQSLKSRPRDQLHSLTNYWTKWQQYKDQNGALRQNKGANRVALIQAGQSVRPDYYRRRIQRDIPRGTSLERKRFRVRISKLQRTLELTIVKIVREEES